MRLIFALFGIVMIGVIALFPPNGTGQDWSRKNDSTFRYQTGQVSKETGQPVEIELGPLVAGAVFAVSLLAALWCITSGPVTASAVPSRAMGGLHPAEPAKE